MKHRYWTSLLAATATLLTVAGAHAETASLWVRADGSNFMPRIVDAFNKSHTDQIKLDIIPNAEIIQKYGTSVAGGTAPDALSLDLIYTPVVRGGRAARGHHRLGQVAAVSGAAVARACEGGDVQGPHLRPAVLGRQLRADLEQGAVQAGRARSEQGPGELAGDRRRRGQGFGARRRHQGILLSPATARAATSSPSCRSSGRRAATS